VKYHQGKLQGEPIVKRRLRLIALVIAPVIAPVIALACALPFSAAAQQAVVAVYDPLSDKVATAEADIAAPAAPK
jgi:hypothetical protein